MKRETLCFSTIDLCRPFTDCGSLKCSVFSCSGWDAFGQTSARCKGFHGSPRKESEGEGERERGPFYTAVFKAHLWFEPWMISIFSVSSGVWWRRQRRRKKKRCFGGKAKHGDNCRALFSTDKKIWIPVHLHANVWVRSGSQSELEQVAQVGRISSFKSFSALMTFIKITSLNMWSLVY